MVSMFVFLQVDDSSAEQLEHATRAQAESEVWHRERAFRITASNVSRIMRVREENRDKLAEALCKPEVTMTVPALIWGKANEPAARRAYEEQFGVRVQKCGLMVDVQRPYLGASPDGRHDDTLVEIKCPYAIREEVPTPTNYNHIERDENDKLVLSERSKYYAQVQTQMHCAKMRMCNFVIFTKKALLILPVQYDESYVLHLLAKVDQFYSVHFVPALISARFGVSKPIQGNVEVVFVD